MTYILALDQGTTSSRALVFDRAGRTVAMAQKEFQQYYPKPGWVEHDANEIWASQLAVANQAIERAGISSRELFAIGITNQRETTVIWDRATSQPIAPAIVWQDRRTAETCAAIAATHGEMIQAKTGLVVDAYFSASKIAWLLDEVDGARQRAERGELAFGTIDSWLVWCLSNGSQHITDASNASRTMLYDINKGAWDEELLDLWRIPRALLPEVVDCSGALASTDLFGSTIPIAGMAGDQQAALVGQACIEPGMAKCTYGTGCFILMHTGTSPVVSRHRLVTTVANQVNGVREYALEGSVFMGGATVQWLRDELGMFEHASEIESVARGVDDSDGVVLVPAFVGLGAPDWDPNARGLMIGLTRGTTRGHIARAALEGIAWQVADVARAMVLDSEVTLHELRVDGGAAANDLLMQIQADFLGVPLARPQNVECTALGAAMLAACGAGLVSDRREITALWQRDKAFAPSLPDRDRTERHATWRKAVERAKAWQ